MDGNFKKVPSQSDTSVSIDSNDSKDDSKDTEHITVEKEENDTVTSTSPETEEDETEEEPEEPTLTPEEKEWQNYLMAQVEIGLNIRSEASLDGELVGRMRKGDRATILEIGEEWTKIRSGKIEGYVNNAFCLFGTDALNLAKEVCSTTATCTTETLRIRNGMTMESEVVGDMEEGETLTVDTTVQTEDGWVAVIYEGKTYYVSAEYVTVSLNNGEAITMDEVYAIEKEKEEEERRKQEEAARQEAIKNAEANKQYAATVEELDLLAALIYCEANIEPYEAKVAVGAVVINRVLSSVFPDTVVGVIYQKKQFSPVGSGRLALALANNKATPSCYQAADAAMSGTTNVGGCVFFRTPIPGLTGQQIGGHIFY
jgi:uncharacterized protein YgiM (DUF1202 family)